MRTQRILKPGQPGTKKLLERFGDDLLCVRYRYSLKDKRKYKTVELIVDNTPWKPKPDSPLMKKTMRVKVKYGEIDLGRKVKSFGGIWNKKEKVWELPYKNVLKLGLEKRMVE